MKNYCHYKHIIGLKISSSAERVHKQITEDVINLKELHAHVAQVIIIKVSNTVKAWSSKEISVKQCATTWQSLRKE